MCTVSTERKKKQNPTHEQHRLIFPCSELSVTASIMLVKICSKWIQIQHTTCIFKSNFILQFLYSNRQNAREKEKKAHLRFYNESVWIFSIPQKPICVFTAAHALLTVCHFYFQWKKKKINSSLPSTGSIKQMCFASHFKGKQISNRFQRSDLLWFYYSILFSVEFDD